MAASAVAQTNPLPETAPKWGPFVDFGGQAGTQRNIGEGDLFAPLWQNGDSMLFADIRTRFDDRDNREGNFGLGARHMLDDGWNLGVYGYYDRRRTALGNYFGEGTFGAEALSLDWDLRANGYQPIGTNLKNSGTVSASTAALAGTAVLVTTSGSFTQEVEQPGFDAEAGWRVPIFAADSTTQLRVYGGGYRFAADNTKVTAGPRGRLDLTIDQVPYLWNGARLDLGGEVQHDGPRGTQAFALISLRIPLEFFPSEAPATLTPMERRMEDPVVRDVDIVTQTRTVSTPTLVETATQTAGGSPITVFSSASTTGAALPGAVAAIANNSTAVLSGSFTVTSAVNLGGNKNLIAGSVTVLTPSGRTAVLNTPATISSANLSTTIQAPGNNTISGLTIVATDNGGGSRAIDLNSTGGNYNILNNTFTMTETGANAIIAIATDRNPNIAISGNSFTLTGGTSATALGLNSVTLGATTATVSGNTFNVSGATNNFAASVAQATINSGSTGNVLTAGTCSGTSASGQISFTNGSHCP